MPTSTASSTHYVNVALPIPKGPFTYTSSKPLEPGMRVSVPFINSSKIGVVLDSPETCSIKRLKAIERVHDESPVVTQTMLTLSEWIAEYYMCSYGEAISNAIPALIKRGRKIDSLDWVGSDYKAHAFKFKLTQEQREVVEKIDHAILENKKKTFLLEGITGSGKSEVYLRLIDSVLAQGKSAICLVPEIALTLRLVSYFEENFGEMIEVLHSRLTEKERFEAWGRIKRGEKRLVLGPRSAIFSPVRDLGLIIIDEEHETSFKQEDTPRYHTRNVAEKLAEIEGAVLLMGTATPSLESRKRAADGEIEFLRLTHRIANRPLPEVDVVDLKNEMTKGGNLLLSRPLRLQIEQVIKRGESTLLFLNRRGFATHLQCMDCGETLNCPHCQVSLTYHAKEEKSLCHYCNYQTENHEVCPSCKSKHIKYGGGGTEKVEAAIQQYFPTARVDRLDTDRVRKKGEAQSILRRFANREIDILIGTQMLAKGFDFPHVTLVGVINADSMLSMPDFRAFERSFQLMTQVAGRAGRGEKKGKVLVQTFMPESYVVHHAREHDYTSFYEKEIFQRKELNYPPFTHMINIIIRSQDEEKVKKQITKLADKLNEVQSDHKDISLMGPAPLPFYKLRTFYRWHVMLKGNNLPEMRDIVREITKTFSRSKGTYLAVDVDPVSIL